MVNSVLLLVANDVALARELSLLSDRNKCCTETHSEDWAEEESSGVKTDNNINLLGGGREKVGDGVIEDVGHEMGEQGLSGDGVSEDGLHEIRNDLRGCQPKVIRGSRSMNCTYEKVQEDNTLWTSMITIQHEKGAG